MKIENLVDDWIKLDAYIENNKKELRAITDEYSQANFKANERINAIKQQVETYMKENGVAEDIILGDMTNTKLAYTTRENVVINDEAVPDDYIVQKPQINKKLINEDMKALRDEGEPLPNWATFETTRNLVYRFVKK